VRCSAARARIIPREREFSRSYFAHRFDEPRLTIFLSKGNSSNFAHELEVISFR